MNPRNDTRVCLWSDPLTHTKHTSPNSITHTPKQCSCFLQRFTFQQHFQGHAGHFASQENVLRDFRRVLITWSLRSPWSAYRLLRRRSFKHHQKFALQDNDTKNTRLAPQFKTWSFNTLDASLLWLPCLIFAYLILETKTFAPCTPFFPSDFMLDLFPPLSTSFHFLARPFFPVGTCKNPALLGNRYPAVADLLADTCSGITAPKHA